MEFKNSQQVSEVLGTTFTFEQALLVENYIRHGIRPDPDGCMGCDANYIRLVTSDMDRYVAPEEEPVDEITELADTFGVTKQSVTEIVDVDRAKPVARKRK